MTLRMLKLKNKLQESQSQSRSRMIRTKRYLAIFLQREASMTTSRRQISNLRLKKLTVKTKKNNFLPLPLLHILKRLLSPSKRMNLPNLNQAKTDCKKHRYLQLLFHNY